MMKMGIEQALAEIKRVMKLPTAGGMVIVSHDALRVAAEVLKRPNKQPPMKDHEKIFFSLCYGLRGIYKPRDVVNILSETIPHKRCWYYLRKWGDLGFYDYGVTEDLGWFYPDKIPPRYKENIKEQDPVKLAPALARYVMDELAAGTITQDQARDMLGLPPR